MKTAKLREFANFGQAIWYDYLRRSSITSGEMQSLIEEGVRGVLSNPSIFEKAIDGSIDYDEDLNQLAKQGKSLAEIFEELVVNDVARTADLLRPVYDALDGADGFVSLEINPKLAHDTEGMVVEARRLYTKLKRPNAMIRIPATSAGIQATKALVGEGIKVNVSLIFTIAQYEAATEAYIAGLEKLASTESNLRQVTSVASFSISRLDTAIDPKLDKIGERRLQGKIAIANAKMAYAQFREIFRSARWQHLKSKGGHVQRLLWASTGTKNPCYPDTHYVDSLIGIDTINAVAPATLRALLDHGHVGNTLETGVDEARTIIARLYDLGVNLEAVGLELQEDSIAASSKSVESILTNIAQKRDRLLAGWQNESASLGPYQTRVDARLAEMSKNRVLKRIWAHDYTVWKPQPTETSNRLGWLHTAEVMYENLHHMSERIEGIRSAGYTHTILLGMGGSSLAPEVLLKTFGHKEGYPNMTVLDTTDPGAVLNHAKRLNPAQTLFIVSSKSGTTVDTISLFKFFYNRVSSVVGDEQAGEHFIAITDPKTELAALAERYRFRATFLTDPNIGGRYSALSYFALVPAALIGVDVSRMLSEEMTVNCGCEPCVDPKSNPGAWLGAILGELAGAGRDKVTFVASPRVASFGDWVEQLIAESTGKDGRGILPVVGEPLGSPNVYRNDRLFVYLQLENDSTHESTLAALEEAGHPVIRLRLRDPYELGRQFFLWEMATAIAGYILGINPFDQPNVETAKVLARQMVSEYKAKGKLPEENPLLIGDEITVYGDVAADNLGKALIAFLNQAREGAYVALQAYVQPTAETDVRLHTLRIRIRDRFKLATTVGYGPRYLHSTGQLHKGDAGLGLFIQFTANDLQDVAIPDEPGSSSSSISFGLLKAAQALGDRRALKHAGRRTIRFHLKDFIRGLTHLTEALE